MNIVTNRIQNDYMERLSKANQAVESLINDKSIFEGNSALDKKKKNILSQMREDDSRKDCVIGAKSTKEAYDCVRDKETKKMTLKCGTGISKKEPAMKCGAGKCGAGMK